MTPGQRRGREPREWWVDKTLFEAKGYVQQRAWCSDFERPDTVRVVEHGALAEALARVEELSTKYRNVELANKEMTRNDHATFGQLLNRIAELEKALEFYAQLGHDLYAPGSMTETMIKSDGGDRARQALKPKEREG